MVGAIIAVVLILAGVLIFVPFMIRRALKAGKQARNFIPDLLRLTGMQLNNDTLLGTYKNFQTVVNFGLGLNAGKMIMAGPGMGNQLHAAHGRNTFYQTLHIKVQMPGSNAPPLGIKEKVGILRTDEFLNEIIQKQRMELPEMKIDHDLKRVRFYGNDEAFARKFTHDPELKRLLSDWHYCDIRIGGNLVEFRLDDNMVQPTFGGERLASPGYVVQALDIATRCAQLAGS
jgi:hypothetical protein